MENWKTKVLNLAGIYNILWGAWVIVFPFHIFQISSMPYPLYPSIWQCVGMIVGVYGLGYLIAARDPLKHWPIVLVGLIGKVLGPVGFLKNFIDGVFPLQFSLTIITNDLIWWVPFFLILKEAYLQRDK